MVKRMISVAKNHLESSSHYFGRAHDLSFRTQSKPTLESRPHGDGTKHMIAPFSASAHLSTCSLTWRCPGLHLGSSLCSGAAIFWETPSTYGDSFHSPFHVTRSAPPAVPCCHLVIPQVSPTHHIPEWKSFSCHHPPIILRTASIYRPGNHSSSLPLLQALSVLHIFAALPQACCPSPS